MEINDKLKILSLTQAEITALGSVDAGTIVYNSTTNALETYNGTAWVASGGGGGGKEPYVVDTVVDTFIITNNQRPTPGNFVLSGTNYTDRPFIFQQDVNLKAIQIRQTSTTAAAGNSGLFAIYELTGLTAIGGTYTFTKVYQDPTVFDFSGSLGGTDQNITLATPFTFEAGKVYMTVLGATSTTSGAGRPFVRGAFQAKDSKVLGYNGVNGNGDPQIIRSLGSSSVTVTGTTMPTSINFVPQMNANGATGGLVKMTVQNA